MDYLWARWGPHRLPRKWLLEIAKGSTDKHEIILRKALYNQRVKKN